METYKQWLRSLGRSEHTITNYLNTARSFQAWYLKQTKTESFNPLDVSQLDLQEWKAFLLNEATYSRIHSKGSKEADPKRYSVSSIQTFIKSIKTYFDFLIAAEVITSNPALKLHPPKDENEFEVDLRWLEDDERKRLVEHIEDPGLSEKNSWKHSRNKAIVYAGLYAGLRRSEMVNLKVDDISFENDSLVVQDEHGSKARSLPMNKALKNALLDWIELRGQQDHPYVFVSQRGGKLSENAIWNVCETIAKKISMKDFSPHILRHSFAMELVAKGYKIKEIAALLGHSNLNFTRVYKRPSKANKRLTKESISGE